MVSLSPDGRIPFVGRRGELQRLAEARRLLEGYRERPSHMIVLEGCAGIGKTACAEQFLGQLERDQGTFVGRAIWNPHLHRHPFAPLLDALDRLYSSGRTGRRLLSFFSHAAYRPLLSLLPLTAQATGHDDDGGVSLPTSALAALIAEALVHAARMRPTVLLLDDLHELSDEEREALPLLHAGLRSEPVLLVATVRNDLPAYEQIRTTLNALTAERIPIGSLPTAESIELVARLCGARVGMSIGEDLARLAEGVPQRVVEALRLLAERRLLRHTGDGIWEFDGSFDPRLFSPDDLDLFGRLHRTNPSEVQLLELLACAGGSAEESDLLRWSALLDGETSGEQARSALATLQQEGVIRRSTAVEGEWTFMHGSLTKAMREELGEEECRNLARLIVAEHGSGRSLLGWLENPAMCEALPSVLPPRESAERAHLFTELLGNGNYTPSSWEVRVRGSIYRGLLARRALLSGRECVSLLAQTSQLSAVRLGFNEAEKLMQEAYAISSSDSSAADLHASVCILLASHRIGLDRNAQVADLLDEAERALEKIESPRERRVAEMNLAKHRTMTVPLDQPELAVLHAERALRSAEQLGDIEEVEQLQSDLLVRAARLRDSERVRTISSDLLRQLRSGGRRPASWVIVQGVRALLGLGEVFAARALFETWSEETPPQQFDRTAVHSYLVLLFALVDGDLEEAVEAAEAGRGEIGRLRAGSTTLPWELLGVDVGLKFFSLQALIASGRFVEAQELAGRILLEKPSTHTRLPEVHDVAQLASDWLRWRRTLPGDGRVALVWNPPESDYVEVVDDQAAAEDYRREWGERQAMPPILFMEQMLLAELECAEGRYETSLAAIERAEMVSTRFYAWRSTVESRIARVTVALRMMQTRRGEGGTPVVDDANAIFDQLAERGLTDRVEQLRKLFTTEAGLIGGAGARALIDAIDRSAAAAALAASAALRNSRSREAGPIDRPRLFLMGPIRLMPRHSYLELGESSFGREGARLLLASLVGAELLDRVLTRDELLDRVANNPRGGRAQQKALYNAMSAVRAACDSPSAIVAVGPSGMKLNHDPAVEGSVWVDVLEMRRAVIDGEENERTGETSRAVDDFTYAVALGRKGEFGADIYTEWIEGARDAARGLLRRAAFGLARIGLRTGLVASGLDAVAMVLLRDPYDEEAYRLLARLHAEEGNRAAALRTLTTCRTMLLEEFDAEPEEETERLMDELRGRRGRRAVVEE